MYANAKPTSLTIGLQRVEDPYAFRSPTTFWSYHTLIIREDRSSSLYLTAALLFYPIDKISLIYHSVAQLLATKVMVTS